MLREALTLPSATMYFVFSVEEIVAESARAPSDIINITQVKKKTQLTKQSGVKSGKFPERRDRRCRRPISAGRRLCPAWMEPKNLSGLAAAYSFRSCVGPPFDAMMMNDGPRVTLRHAFTMALIRLAMRETTAADTHSRTRHTHTQTERCYGMLPRFRRRRHGQKIFLFIERAVIPRSSAGADRDCSSGQTPASPEYNVVVHFWPLSLTTAATSSSSSSPLLLSQRQTGGRRNPPFREREREKKNRKQWGLPAAEARMCTAEGLHSTRIAAVRARQYSVVTDWIDIDHKLVIYRLTPDEARAHARTLLTHQLLLYWFGSTFLVVARSLIRSPLGQKTNKSLRLSTFMCQ